MGYGLGGGEVTERSLLANWCRHRMVMLLHGLTSAVGSLSWGTLDLQ
jgi:hypothetical protein